MSLALSFIPAGAHAAARQPPAEYAVYIAAMRKADAITDPLQRCLALSRPARQHLAGGRGEGALHDVPDARALHAGPDRRHVGEARWRGGTGVRVQRAARRALQGAGAARTAQRGAACVPRQRPRQGRAHRARMARRGARQCVRAGSAGACAVAAWLGCARRRLRQQDGPREAEEDGRVLRQGGEGIPGGAGGHEPAAAGLRRADGDRPQHFRQPADVRDGALPLHRPDLLLRGRRTDERRRAALGRLRGRDEACRRVRAGEGGDQSGAVGVRVQRRVLPDLADGRWRRRVDRRAGTCGAAGAERGLPAAGRRGLPAQGRCLEGVGVSLAGAALHAGLRAGVALPRAGAAAPGRVEVGACRCRARGQAGSGQRPCPRIARRHRARTRGPCRRRAAFQARDGRQEDAGKTPSTTTAAACSMPSGSTRRARASTTCWPPIRRIRRHGGSG
jgi:hypothetical protein